MVGLALVPATGAASNSSFVRGGSGVISNTGVWPHRFEVAQPADILTFAGIPNSIQYENRLGENSGSSAATWEIWKYRLAGGGYLDYSFHRSGGRWLFSQIDTNRRQFRTARGTRVGMSYAEAKKREGVSYTPGCIDTGFWHFRDGYRYAVIAGALPGQSVHALHAYGPSEPLC